MKNIFSGLTRRLTSWAWAKEIEVSESLVKIVELHAKDGELQIEIEQRPEVREWVARCFASLVAESPNYTEMKFELKNPTNDYEWITVLVQKGKGKTPHELRQIAELKLKNMEAFLNKEK